MPRSLELLLTESVDNLGIVGDVVKVRTGYARNYLLPNNYATTPTEDKIKALAAKRAEAERQQRELRAQREAMIKKMEGLEVAIIRSCNDQGMLYGSITQQDVCDVLSQQGYHLKPRDVRLGQTIKRIDTYHITIKVASDLETEVTLKIQPDRELETHRRDAEPAEPAPDASADTAPEAGERHGKGERKGRKEAPEAPKADDTPVGKFSKPKAPAEPAPDAGNKKDSAKGSKGKRDR